VAEHGQRVLLLGGTSEIGLAVIRALGLAPQAEVVLAGRDAEGLTAAGKTLPCRVSVVAWDATEVAGHQALIDGVFAGGAVDIVIAAAGVLVPQAELARDVVRAATLIQASFTGQVSTLLAVAGHLRAQGHGAIVVLSSVAAVRPRKGNLVYGAAKAGLDAFTRGLTDALHGTGVRVLLVRPGFVTGKMTRDMPKQPLATTPEAVATATARALRTPSRPPHAPRAQRGTRFNAWGLHRPRRTVWVPAKLAFLAPAMHLIPRPLWRRISR
jgi:decaprenylphospho-beta-D-erythro-pentofuranosid-2-ulose 2-reductase